MAYIFSDALVSGLRRRIVLASRSLARKKLAVRRKLESAGLEDVSRSASGRSAIDALCFGRVYLETQEQPEFPLDQIDMFGMFQTISKISLYSFLLLLCLSLTNCNTDERNSEDKGLFDFSDDTDTAVEYIHEANRNLKSIKALYNQNNPRVEELKKALNDKDIEKVKKISDELSLVIIDGYVLAENAKEKIDKAKNLSGISTEFRDYLELKSESLELQIKAFNYRRDSAKLFRDEFGTEDTSKLDTAKAKFIENEKKFAEHITEAKKKNDQADKMWSESRRKKG